MKAGKVQQAVREPRLGQPGQSSAGNAAQSLPLGLPRGESARREQPLALPACGNEPCRGLCALVQVNGQWKGHSAGGCGNFRDTYKNNPIYQIQLDKTGPLLIELRGPRWVEAKQCHSPASSLLQLRENRSLPPLQLGV